LATRHKNCLGDVRPCLHFPSSKSPAVGPDSLVCSRYHPSTQTAEKFVFFMKRKVPLPEPETLILDSSSPDDPTLPRPPHSRGWKQTPASQRELEKLQLKLERTLKLGGLVPERSYLLDRLCNKVGPLPESAPRPTKNPLSSLEASD
jgi:hypothetical protein